MSEICNVYCDESCHLEHDRQKAMVLGAIWCPLDKSREIAVRLREIKATVVDLKEQLKRLKKEKAGKEAIAALNAEIKEKEKSARDPESKAADIDAAVFDLKAVNPNTVAKVDTRTPQEIIANIEAHAKIVNQALSNLSRLLDMSK